MKMSDMHSVNVYGVILNCLFRATLIGTLAAEDGPCTTGCPHSCADIYKANMSLPSGVYTLYNSTNHEFRVFCSFSPGYGYTYLSRLNTVDIDIDGLYTTTDHVLIRHKQTDNTQWEVNIKQMTPHSLRPLSVQYNTHTGYSAFRNFQMGKPYIYLGFLPESAILHENVTDIQGYQCAGEDIEFENCDAKPNGYFVFLANQNKTHQLKKFRKMYQLAMKGWKKFAEKISESMPKDYFYFMENYMGKCGGYLTTAYMRNVIGASLGLRYDIKCSIPDAIERGSKDTNDTSYGTMVTYTCHAGYSIESGTRQRTCSGGGSWSGILPVCSRGKDVWSIWTSWDTCSATCASGSQVRSRYCIDPSIDTTDTTCLGPSSETRGCKLQICPEAFPISVVVSIPLVIVLIGVTAAVICVYKKRQRHVKTPKETFDNSRNANELDMDVMNIYMNDETTQSTTAKEMSTPESRDDCYEDPNVITAELSYRDYNFVYTPDKKSLVNTYSHLSNKTPFVDNTYSHASANHPAATCSTDDEAYSKLTGDLYINKDKLAENDESDGTYNTTQTVRKHDTIHMLRDNHDDDEYNHIIFSVSKSLDSGNETPDGYDKLAFRT